MISRKGKGPPRASRKGGFQGVPDPFFRMEIIIRKKKERYFSALRHTPSQEARLAVSRENRQEYDNEKRAKELSRKMPDSCQEYNAVAVAKMMSIDEHKARKLIQSKSRGMVLDGKID